MCGICEKFDFTEKVIDRKLISSMCKVLIHRGPDDMNIYTAPYIGLVQRRLSIIDLRRTACMPLSNENGSEVNYQNC